MRSQCPPPFVHACGGARYFVLCAKVLNPRAFMEPEAEDQLASSLEVGVAVLSVRACTFTLYPHASCIPRPTLCCVDVHCARVPF